MSDTNTEILISQRLVLKEGAPVMVLKNISPMVVNGLMGTVQKLTKNAVTVHFPHLNLEHTFEAEVFTK